MRSSLLLVVATAGVTVLMSNACSGDDGAPVPPRAATVADTTLPAEDAAVPEPPPPAENDAAPPPATGSKGCKIAPVGTGSVAKRTTTAGGKARTYHLSVPAGVKTKQALPLVFVLHGATDTKPQNMHDWFGVEGLMTAPTLAVYPQALERTRADGTGGKVTRWDLSGNDDLAFFDTMLAELSDAYCVDREHVFVTGFSSGGNFSQHLGCLRPKDVKAMGVVAGPGPFTDTCGGAVAAWMTHDKNDQALPVADARSSRDFWALENGCKKTTWSPVPGRPECQRNTTCPSAEPVVYCETSGVGHEVPKFAVPSIAAFFSSLLK